MAGTVCWDNSLCLFPNFSNSLAIARLNLECYVTSEDVCAHADKSTSIDLMKQSVLPILLPCKIVLVLATILFQFIAY